MSLWTIRRADLDDAGPLAACIDAAYSQFAARIADLPPVSADCAGEIAKYQVWVADIGGGVVGGLVMIPEEGFMRLANVAVRPDHQGSGLGRALIMLAETESAAKGYSEMRLTTHVDMPENVQLYRHFGWEHVHRHGNKISMKKLV